MKNIKHFEREINLIVNEDLRMAVKSYMEERQITFGRMALPVVASIILNFHKAMAVLFATLKPL